MSAVIEISELTKTYRRSHLGRLRTTPGVANITFSLNDGEIFGLIGPNGSGKTTTIKLILGLLKPDTGSIKLMGRAMPDTKALGFIGYLPEIPYFYPHLTSREILSFYAQLSGIPANAVNGKVESAINLVNMQPHAGRRLKEYSKGMLQRIGLAQAVLHDPKILILDEPASGLDPLGILEMRELILKLNQTGKTIFFSSHSISEVERICHRVAIMSQGKILKIFNQEEWRQEPGKLEKLFIATIKDQTNQPKS